LFCLGVLEWTEYTDMLGRVVLGSWGGKAFTMIDKHPYSIPAWDDKILHLVQAIIRTLSTLFYT